MNMRNTVKISSILLGGLVLVLLIACEPKEIETDEFDINLPGATITSISPAEAMIESTVTIKGSGFNDERLKVYIGTSDTIIYTLVSDNTITLEVPRNVSSGPILISNALGVDTYSGDTLTVTYPDVSIDDDISDTIFLSDVYTITGSNLDMLTSVAVGDTSLSLTPNYGSGVPGEITSWALNFQDVNFKGDFVSLAFEQKSGNKIADIGPLKVMDDYPSAKPLYTDPDTVALGGTFNIIFDDFSAAKLVTKVDFALTRTSGGSVDTWTEADFTFGKYFITVTVPLDALDGQIRISNYYEEEEYISVILE
jgi:hypothetical protein